MGKYQVEVSRGRKAYAPIDIPRTTIPVAHDTMLANARLLKPGTRIRIRDIKTGKVIARRMIPGE